MKRLFITLFLPETTVVYLSLPPSVVQRATVVSSPKPRIDRCPCVVVSLLVDEVKSPGLTTAAFVRLILALDPAHGELSRAMRNRCVEIHVPGELFNDTDTPVGEQTCAPLEGLTWDEVKQINVSKCLNAEELRMLDNFLQTIGEDLARADAGDLVAAAIKLNVSSKWKI